MKSAQKQKQRLGGKSLSRMRLVRVAVIAVAAVLVCGVLDRFTEIFVGLEQDAYGQRMEMAAWKHPELTEDVLKRVTVVTVSDTSFDPANPDRLPGPPLPRQYYIRLIQELTRDGARVIAFDILFDKTQSGDAALAGAIQRSGRVLLACEDKGTAEQPSFVLPEPMLARAAADRGHTSVPEDADRPAIDRVRPVLMERERQMPAFSVQADRMYRGMTQGPLRPTGNGWQFGNHRIPVDSDGTFKIRYFDLPDTTFGQYPLEEVIRKDRPCRSDFLGKVVVVGYATEISGDKDQHLTPVGQKWGVEIQAHAIATLLEGHFIRDASVGAETVTLIVLASLAALFASVWQLKRMALFLMLLLPVYYVFNVWMFVSQGVDLHLVAPSVTVILMALGVLLERGLTEEQEKTRVRGLLHRYVSPQIAGYILQHPELLGRAGRRVTGTVLFSDIRGFTALSEQMPPEELVSRMNEYFQTMTDIVFRHEGTAASMVGDAMLALFGVPVPAPDHARRAVAAAIEMQDTLRALQERWRTQGQPIFDIGIGINTGEMVVGEVGGQHLTNFTVYGLQVNLASRVEGLNKELGTCLLITRATYRPVAEEIEARGPLQMPVKGVEEPVEVFEVLGWRTGEAPAQDAAW